MMSSLQRGWQRGRTGPEMPLEGAPYDGADYGSTDGATDFGAGEGPR
jgi:hypothetical protein